MEREEAGQGGQESEKVKLAKLLRCLAQSCCRATYVHQQAT